MGANSRIAWCDHTFNPWWGCTRVGPGCAGCYAEGWAKRTGFELWGPDKPRRFFDEPHWREPARWNERARVEGLRFRIFCMSMGDLFEARPDLVGPRNRVFDIMRRTPNLDWLVLTKRIGEVDAMVEACGEWPVNVRLGLTVVNQNEARSLVPVLLRLCAKWGMGNFLSLEPQLEAIDLEDVIIDDGLPGETHVNFLHCDVGPEDDEEFGARTVEWVITGCEKKGGRPGRPYDPAWARKLRDQCTVYGVPFFYKQGPGPDGRVVECPELDGRRWMEVPLSFNAAQPDTQLADCDCPGCKHDVGCFRGGAR